MYLKVLFVPEIRDISLKGTGCVSLKHLILMVMFSFEFVTKIMNKDNDEDVSEIMSVIRL
jgi:hypothetical protein